MNHPTFHNPSSEKGRQDFRPAAKSDPDGQLTGRAHQMRGSNGEQSTKFRTSDALVSRGSSRGTNVRKFGSPNPNPTSLPPLSTRELNRETQCIVLQFPTDQVAEEQGACARAIENQKNGDSGISAKNLINWARRNSRVRAEVARLIGLSGAVTDPDFMEGAEGIAKYYVRQLMGDFPGHPGPLGCNSDAGDEDQDLVTGDLFGGMP